MRSLRLTHQSYEEVMLGLFLFTALASAMLVFFLRLPGSTSGAGVAAAALALLFAFVANELTRPQNRFSSAMAVLTFAIIGAPLGIVVVQALGLA